MAATLIELACRACNSTKQFVAGTTYNGKPVEDWFRDDCDELCKDCRDELAAARQPVARATDPHTSWAAANSISIDTLRHSQKAVLAVLRDMGSATLEELVAEYMKRAHAGVVSMQSVSGIRTRCKELKDKSFVYETGQTRPGSSHRLAQVLAAR